MANNKDAEPVPVPHRRERPPGRLRVVGSPTAKAVIVGDPVQAVVHVRLAPAASRRGFEQYVRTLACVRCAWQVTGDVDYELLVACRAIAELDGVLTCLRGCKGTEVTSAGLVVREVAGLGGGPRRARSGGDSCTRPVPRASSTSVTPRSSANAASAAVGVRPAGQDR